MQCSVLLYSLLYKYCCTAVWRPPPPQCSSCSRHRLSGRRSYLHPQFTAQLVGACSYWYLGTEHVFLWPCAYYYYFLRLKFLTTKFLTGDAVCNLVVLHHVHHDVVRPLRVRVFYPLRPVVAQSIPFRRGGVDYVRRSTMGVMRHHAACVMAGEERGGEGREWGERGGKEREGMSVNEETREDEHIGALYVTPRVKNTLHSKVKRTGRNCRA